MINAVAPRDDFPALSQPGRGGGSLVYLDSAATSHRPLQVLEAVRRYDTQCNGGVNRGAHILAEKASLAYEDAREAVASFVGAQPCELIFTSGTTASLNMLAAIVGNISAGRASSVPAPRSEAGRAALKRLKLSEASNIVITQAEHHANFIPWQELALRTGAELRMMRLDEEGRINLEDLRLIDEHTALLAFTHISNVSGAISPVEAMTAAAHEAGALVVLDACQSVPHVPIDFHALDVDFAAFSGHKMLGPTGIGAFYGKAELLRALPPGTFGGSMVEIVSFEKTTYAEPPARFEAGTMPTAQAVGMGEASRYLSAIGMEKVAAHEAALTKRLLEGMAEIAHVRILGPTSQENRGSAVAFEVAGVHPHDVGQYLDSRDIAIRVGHHCAQPIHQHFGVYASSRVSVGPYNTSDEIDAFLDALSTVRSYFHC